MEAMGRDRMSALVACFQPSAAKAAGAPSMPGTATAGLPLFKGFGGNREAHAAAWSSIPQLGVGLDKSP
jgi:hypothetical protein